MSAVSIADLIGPEKRIESLGGGNAELVISELLEHLAGAEDLPSSAVDTIRRAVLSREREGSTGIGHGIGIPHMKDCPFVTELCGVFGRHLGGIDFATTDGEPAHLFFLILTPPGGASDHIQIMKKIVTMSRDRKTLNYLIKAESFDNFDAILREIDDQTG